MNRSQSDGDYQQEFLSFLPVSNGWSPQTILDGLNTQLSRDFVERFGFRSFRFIIDTYGLGPSLLSPIYYLSWPVSFESIFQVLSPRARSLFAAYDGWSLFIDADLMTPEELDRLNFQVIRGIVSIYPQRAVGVLRSSLTK